MQMLVEEPVKQCIEYLKRRTTEKQRHNAGLDIGYVPAGPHAFLRLSGQFGPLQLIFHWPEASGFIFYFFLVLRMPPLFLLGIGKTRKATLIRTYFFVIYRPNVQKCATSLVKS